MRWNTQYSGGCAAVPAHQGLRYGLYGHVYYCAAEAGGVVAESFYFPRDRDPPTVRLQRADFRLPVPYPPMSAEVEQVLAERLTRAYGPGSVPENVFGAGAYRPNPGLSWRAGGVTIVLHRNRNHVAPAGVRQGVQLVAVRQEVLDERDRERQASEGLVPFVRTEQLRRELGPLYPEAGAATLPALLELLALVGTGDPDRNALLLAAADSLVVRLGEELVSRSVQHAGEVLTEAPLAAEARERLRPHGVSYSRIGHYSGALEYDRSLLLKAWTGSPATPWGQRAFLEIQRLGCSVPGFGCDGVNCFLEVIRQGERFLLDFPDTPFRLEQTYHLALAHEAWWSLSLAAPDDITAHGARVDARSGEAARLRAIELYEELLRLAPNSPQAYLGQLALPRLRLRLDTAERAFFCWSC
ncbi:MAG: hypothetical protein IPM24_27880 [Bryobacterales bacterium]|nr:hypothetical protein [Bryobacterales bacterium]